MLNLKVKGFLSGEEFQRSRSLRKAAKRSVIIWVEYPKNTYNVTRRYIAELKRSHRGLIIPRIFRFCHFCDPDHASYLYHPEIRVIQCWSIRILGSALSIHNRFIFLFASTAVCHFLFCHAFSRQSDPTGLLIDVLKAFRKWLRCRGDICLESWTTRCHWHSGVKTLLREPTFWNKKKVQVRKCSPSIEL